jgi:hypothetical protein
MTTLVKAGTFAVKSLAKSIFSDDELQALTTRAAACAVLANKYDSILVSGVVAMTRRAYGVNSLRIGDVLEMIIVSFCLMLGVDDRERQWTHSRVTHDVC